MKDVRSWNGTRLEICVSFDFQTETLYSLFTWFISNILNGDG